MPYTLTLQRNLIALRYKILAGKYVPNSQTIVRAAKKDGISRPLAFLEIEDQLVLKAICDQLQNRLIGDFPDYVNYGRSNLRISPKGEPVDYETWFDVWIRSQDLIKRYVFEQGEESYLVVADVSNFFPSVNLRLLRNSIASKANCNERVVELLFYLLHAMVNRTQYTVDYELGLPMENYDASRLLAHFYLEPVDESFREKGEDSKYIRWVDDILIGVEDKREGKIELGRLQKALESRGLALNAAKSKIVKCLDVQKELFPDENAFLDEATQRSKKKQDVPDFDERLDNFLNEKATKRIGGWSRVLRRYYSVSIMMKSDRLMRYVVDHLRDYPECTINVIKYLYSQRHDGLYVSRLLIFLRDYNLYEDVEINLYEFLTSVRIEWRMGPKLSNYVLDHFFARNKWPEPRHEYVRGLIALLVYKYGDRDSLSEIADYFMGSSEKYFTRYAYYCMYATHDFKERAKNVMLSSEDVNIRRMATFFNDLQESPHKYANDIRRYCRPKYMGKNRGYKYDARLLPLIKILRDTSIRDTVWNDIVTTSLDLLRRTEEKVRDEYTIEWLDRVRQQA